MTPNRKTPDFLMPKRRLGPFRRAVLRGLAILLPPLLTIVIFLWIGNTVADYLLNPMEGLARNVLIEHVVDIRDVQEVPANQIVNNVTTIDETEYRATEDGKLIPASVYQYVREHLGTAPMPENARDIYTRYVNQTWLQRELVVPVFLCVFVLVLYLLGKFLAAGVGSFFWTQLERLINRLPLVRNVYSSVKQVTDFMFTDPDIQYTRVVAIEYPRKGIWCLAFVTGEGMYDIEGAAKEPMVSVFVSTSPMPFTGFALNVKKSETIDMNISIDQAFQFIISCGVVVPPPPTAKTLDEQTDASANRQMAISAPVSGDD
jgi:uncharacterized membrane protein